MTRVVDGRFSAETAVVWADDVATDRHVLRESGVSCSPFAELVVTAAPDTTSPATATSVGTASATGATVAGDALTIEDADPPSGGNTTIVVAVLAMCVGLVRVTAWSGMRRRARRTVRPER